MLAPGRGLRRATHADIARAEGRGTWAVSARIETAWGSTDIGTGLSDPDPDGDPQNARRARRRGRTALDRGARRAPGDPVADARPRRPVPRPAGDRRRFLDRLAVALDPAHGGRVAALEKLLRTRNRLLESPAPDGAWLDAVERELAEVAVAVARGRAELVDGCPRRSRRITMRPRRSGRASQPRRHARSGAGAGERGRGRGRLHAHAAHRAPRVTRRGAHARRRACERSRGPPRPQGHAGRTLLDGRAEGAAGRARARPRAPRGRSAGRHAESCSSTRSRPISTRSGAQAWSKLWNGSAHRPF